MLLEILMKITKDGDPDGTNLVAGDSMVELDKSDELNAGFSAGKFMEIDDFSFGFSLIDHEMGATSTNIPGADALYDGKFKNFIQGDELKDEAGKKLTLDKIYPVTFDEISIERKMDRASPFLFKNCFDSKTVRRISIVKRKTAGASTGSETFSYFRVDFDDVLITDISFSLSDGLPKEDLKFVYRSLTVRYRPQKNDGSPGSVVNVGPLSLMQTKGAGK